MSKADVRIRAYNVGFGDCFLMSVKDGAQYHHILVDFGNAPGKAGSNEAFPSIAANIAKETSGHLDLLVMTHEHLDHMEGFYAQRKVFDAMTVDQVWMSLPSKPDYYKIYKNATPLKKLKEEAHKFRGLAAQRGLVLAPSFESLLQNNLANSDRIDYVRKLSKAPVQYLARGSTIKGKLGSIGINFEILAPEKDVSVYYKGKGHSQFMMNALTASNGGASIWGFPGVNKANAPSNISKGEWNRLKHSIQTGIAEAIQTIDKAQNNTSLVFLAEIAGKRLLFSGDAEIESWEHIKKHCKAQLKPLDFLKVSHHGSWNGTPLDLLDDILPSRKTPAADVLVSTKSKVYGTKNPVPDEDLMAELRKRSKTFTSTESSKKLWVDIEL